MNLWEWKSNKVKSRRGDCDQDCCVVVITRFYWWIHLPTDSSGSAMNCSQDKMLTRSAKVLSFVVPVLGGTWLKHHCLQRKQIPACSCVESGKSFHRDKKIEPIKNSWIHQSHLITRTLIERSVQNTTWRCKHPVEIPTGLESQG